MDHACAAEPSPFEALGVDRTGESKLVHRRNCLSVAEKLRAEPWHDGIEAFPVDGFSQHPVGVQGFPAAPHDHRRGHAERVQSVPLLPHGASVHLAPQRLACLNMGVGSVVAIDREPPAVLPACPLHLKLLLGQADADECAIRSRVPDLLADPQSAVTAAEAQRIVGVALDFPSEVDGSAVVRLPAFPVTVRLAALRPGQAAQESFRLIWVDPALAALGLTLAPACNHLPAHSSPSSRDGSSATSSSSGERSVLDSP